MKSTSEAKNRFGTFGGVFTPSILTILGVILFMRANFVVGQAGISGALLILLIAEVIAILTALSLAGISTNTPIKGGGAYYIISRVLGPEFGGSIGLALFLAQALSVPFYILGFSESVVRSFPAAAPYFVYIAFGTTIVLFIINMVGAKWAIKTQFVVMTLLALALVSLLVGAALVFKPSNFAANWQPGYTDKYTFWGIFAIYFPAVTGIMAGVNMSGDLRDPARSIVRGTFMAILVGSVIYMAQILLCGGMTARESLISNPYGTLIANALLGSGFLIIAGVFCATISSALGSFMGAPRIIQALARDKVLRFLSPLAKGSAHRDEPQRAMWITLVITSVVLLFSAFDPEMKAFDLVAQIVTMFFLCTYGMINLAAFVESFGLNPSFRPQFRLFHWSTALLGALGCLSAMFLINPLAALLAIVIIAVLYIRITKQSYIAAYGDARRGFLHSMVSHGLYQLNRQRTHAKNWRPNFLVLSGKPEYRKTLVLYANWLAANRGIITLAEILQGSLQQLAPLKEEAFNQLEEFINKNGMDNVYPEVVVTENFDEGARVLLQSQSIGPLKANTVLLGWPRSEQRIEPFFHLLRDIHILQKSTVCILDRGVPKEADRRIDIWWRGRSNGALMLIMAYLLTCNWKWKDAKIRILRAVRTEAGRKPAHEALSRLIQAARIKAQVSIIVSEEPISEILPRYSANASVVLMGLQHPQNLDDAINFYRFHAELNEKLPTTILISSNKEADLLA